MDNKVKKRLLWAFFISTGFMVFLLLRIDWRHFSLIADRLNFFSLIISFMFFIFGNIVRTFRFYRLDHIGKKLVHWWNINQFYNLITATLPGGAGEAATAYVLKRFSMFNLLGAFRILLLARLMDLCALSALFFIATLRIESVTPYRNAAIWLSGTLFFVSSISLVPVIERFVLGLIKKLPMRGVLLQKLCERLSDLMEIAKKQRGNKYFVMTLFQSVLIMISAILSVHLLLRAFGADFSLLQSFYCFGVYAVFQIIPVQGIAGIGTQAAWWSLALNAAGYNAPDAIAMGFVLYGTFYLFVALLGLSSLLVWLKGR